MLFQARLKLGGKTASGTLCLLHSAFSQMPDKKLAGTNSLASFAAMAVTKEKKSFIRLAAGVN